MRRWIWVVILAAALWSLWWFYAATTLQRGVDQWLQDRQSEGWQAEVADITVGGYPMVLHAVLDRPTLADPDTGVAVQASTLEIEAPAWWPGYATLRFPEDDVQVATPTGRIALAATRATANLALEPGSALVLQEMAMTSGPWVTKIADGTLWGANALDLRLTQNSETPQRYKVTFTAPAFQPGSVPRRNMRIPADWPVTFDSLQLDMSVLFDRVIDRSTIEVARAQPRQIELRLAEAAWGNLVLRASADLTVSPQGLLSGAFSLQARNWQDMLTLAETGGTLPSAFRPQLENILGALARGSGNPDTIDVTLNLNDGAVSLGFIPLGRVPALIVP